MTQIDSDRTEEDIENGDLREVDDEPLLKSITRKLFNGRNLVIFILVAATCMCVTLGMLALILSITLRVVNSISPTGCHEQPTIFSTPSTFYMTKDLLTGIFKISNDKNSTIATMKHRQYSFPYVIDLMDANAEAISVGKGAFFNLGTSLSVNACAAASPLNSIKQNPHIVGLSYEILSPQLKMVTRVDLDGFLSLHFKITDSNDVAYGTIYKHFTLPEQWTIEITKSHPDVNNQIYFYLAAIISYSSDQ
jgi:hypothetical protein